MVLSYPTGVLCLCVFDRIKHTEIVTGGTVSQISGLLQVAMDEEVAGSVVNDRGKSAPFR